MSTQTNPSARALPPEAVDRLFARFVAIYGAQKMAAAWGNVDPAERNATWLEALSRFPLDVIGDAVRELAEDGGSWPPTLPEFVDRCERHEQRPGRNVRALPVPRRTEREISYGAEQMRRIREMLARATKRVPE